MWVVGIKFLYLFNMYGVILLFALCVCLLIKMTFGVESVKNNFNN